MKKEGQKVTSTDIKKALAGFHEKDFFITECKTCSTYFPDPQGLLKFDGLAIRKSYTKPCITGYEIKVSRGDFLQDNKWHLYLQYCNEFYFVVPAGLVTKEEIPENVGLIYYYPDTTVLRTKRKALYREIEEPVGVYKYIIYSRLAEDRIPFYENRAEYAKDYIRDISEKRKIGAEFGSKMAKDLREAQKRLDELKGCEDKLANYEEIMEILQKYGITWSVRYPDENMLTKLEQALKGTYPIKELDTIQRNVQYALDVCMTIREKYEQPQTATEIMGIARREAMKAEIEACPGHTMED